MIAIEPKEHEPRLTILQECSEGELVSLQTVSLRPILFFSYEGQVAVQGIVIPSGWVATIKSRLEQGRKKVTGLQPHSHTDFHISFLSVVAVFGSCLKDDHSKKNVDYINIPPNPFKPTSSFS